MTGRSPGRAGRWRCPRFLSLRLAAHGPVDQAQDPINNLIRPLSQISRLMVLGDQITVEINQPCTDGVRAKGRNEDSCPVSAELHQPRRPPARRLTGCVFMDKTKVGQVASRQRSPGHIRWTLRWRASCSHGEPDQRDFGQTGDNGFFRPRSLTFVCLHDSLVFCRRIPSRRFGLNDLSTNSAFQADYFAEKMQKYGVSAQK